MTELSDMGKAMMLRRALGFSRTSPKRQPRNDMGDAGALADYDAASPGRWPKATGR